jgi:hypothetical protein
MLDLRNRMFAETNSSPIVPAFITAFGPWVVALTATGFGIWNTLKLRELERLKTQLGHGQLISSTQWNAEFNAYQSLWKSLVPLRASIYKLTRREDELAKIGVDRIDLNPQISLETRQALLGRIAKMLSDSMLAINEHAPFYPADIRAMANDAQSMAHGIYSKHVAAVVSELKKLPEIINTEQELQTFSQTIDNLEELIRARMAVVRVMGRS